MILTDYVFTISPFNSDQFTQLITASNISIALAYINTSGSTVTITFKDVLPGADETLLNSLVSGYVYVAPVLSPVGITVTSQPPFGSKTIVVNGVSKSLYARFTGIQYTVNNGSNLLTYTATYPWVKMLGIEVIGGQVGDYADLKIYDDAIGTYSGHANMLLNQFAYTVNIGPNSYTKMAQFDADLYQNMIIKLTYNSSSLLAKTIGINLLMNEVK